MNPVKLNFKVYQGSTFSEVLRWESSKKIYKAITNITQAAPAVVTAPTHAIPDGWRVKITNVGGMTDINSTDTYNIATVIDTDNIEINSINSLGYKTYTSGGVIEYNEPVDLTGYTARMQLREKIDSTTIIHELTTENGGITIDIVNYKIELNIPAISTEQFTFNTVVYSLELVSNKVIPFASGSITLIKEVTR